MPVGMIAAVCSSQSVPVPCVNVYTLYKPSRTIGLCVCGQDVRLEFLSSGSESARVIVLLGELFSNSVWILQTGNSRDFDWNRGGWWRFLSDHYVALLTATLALKAL